MKWGGGFVLRQLAGPGPLEHACVDTVARSCALHRRNAGRVQGHRRGDGSTTRSGRDRVHLEAGSLRQGV